MQLSLSVAPILSCADNADEGRLELQSWQRWHATAIALELQQGLGRVQAAKASVGEH